MGGKEKQGSDEVFSDSLGWPLDPIAVEVLWFHKRPQLACRGHQETREILCELFFSDVALGLWFDGSNMTAYLLARFVFCIPLGMGWGRCSRCENRESFSAGQRPVPGCTRGGMEAGGKWGDCSLHPCASSALQLRLVGNTQGNSRSCLMWFLSLIVHPRAEKCLPWTKAKGLCVQEPLVCSAKVLLRSSWGGASL